MARFGRVFVAGSTTFAGAAIVRRLSEPGVTLVGIGADEPDLGTPAAVDQFLAEARPDVVIVAAGAQAGIAGNQRRPADLLTDNLLVAAAVIPAAVRHGVKRLLYLASSCIYPKAAPQPFAVGSLGTGPVEPTSSAYAHAKLAGVALVAACRAQHGVSFISAVPGDVYGPGDDFSPEDSHVAAALVRRMHEAKVAGAPRVDVWGSGTPRREFLYVDDLADACAFVLEHYDEAAPINIGTGVTTSTADLATAVRDVVGYTGEIRFDPSRPDGLPLKGLDSGPLQALGWRPSWDLAAGLDNTYAWFLQNKT